MKPTKQTVYLQVNKDSNLTVGAFSPELDEWNSEVYVNKQESFVFTPEQLNEYTQSVIKQTLETAAEKAEIKERKVSYSSSSGSEYGYVQSINKPSITNTFKETFNKFKV